MMGPSQPATVPTRFLLPILRDLDVAGISAEDVIAGTGISGDFKSSSLLDRPEIELDIFIEIYGRCAVLLEHCIAGCNTNLDHRTVALDIFLSLAASCKTLGEVCEVSKEFNSILGDGSDNSGLSFEDDEARFIIGKVGPTRQPPISFVAAKASFFFNLLSWLSAQRINLLRFEISSPQPPYNPVELSVFDAPILYDMPESRLVFRAQDMGLVNIRSKDDVREVARYIAYDPLFLARHSTRVSGRVRSFLYDAVSRGDHIPNSIEVASMLGISQSTLTRHLRNEDTTFLRLKTECRTISAKNLLLHSRQSLLSISKLMGFIDPRSFRRAFKEWTGLLPSTFRSQRQR